MGGNWIEQVRQNYDHHADDQQALDGTAAPTGNAHRWISSYHNNFTRGATALFIVLQSTPHSNSFSPMLPWQCK